MIAFALLAACAPTADAAPTSGLTPPAGWVALPQLATATTAAIAADHVALVGSEAWGDLARGCYAAWVAVRGRGAAADVMATQLLASVRNDVTGIAIRDLVQPAAGTDHGTLSFAFDRATYHGRLRAELTTNQGSIVALACFWNQREPTACAGACTSLLGSMR